MGGWTPAASTVAVFGLTLETHLWPETFGEAAEVGAQNRKLTLEWRLSRVAF
jgi:hypothetical protein